MLRLAGLAGADAEGTPWVNRLVDAVARRRRARARGRAAGLGRAARGEAEDLTTLAQKAAAGSVRFRLPGGPRRHRAAAAAARKQVGAGLKRIDERRTRARAPDRRGSATRRGSPGST